MKKQNKTQDSVSKQTTQVDKNLQRVMARRNFYTLRESAVVYLLAILLPLCVGFVFSYIAVLIATKTGTILPDDPRPIQTLFDTSLGFALPYSLLIQVVFFCIFLAFHKINRVKFSSCNLSFKKAKVSTSLWCLLFGVIFIFGFIWLIEGCFGKVFDALHLILPSDKTISLPNNTVGWLFVNFLLVGIIPPICEELLFRGIIFQGLRSKFSSMASIFLCALMFALIHQDITQFIYPFLLGSVLCFVMERTGNLLYPILIHAANNCTSLLLSFFVETGKLDLSFGFLSANAGLVVVSWLCAIIIAGVAVLLFYLFDKFHLSKQEKNTQEPEGEAGDNTSGITVGKMPLMIIVGMIFTAIMIILNAISTVGTVLSTV